MPPWADNQYSEYLTKHLVLGFFLLCGLQETHALLVVQVET